MGVLACLTGGTDNSNAQNTENCRRRLHWLVHRIRTNREGGPVRSDRRDYDHGSRWRQTSRLERTLSRLRCYKVCGGIYGAPLRLDSVCYAIRNGLLMCLMSMFTQPPDQSINVRIYPCEVVSETRNWGLFSAMFNQIRTYFYRNNNISERRTSSCASLRWKGKIAPPG